MKSLIQDPMAVYAIALIIFLALAFVYGRKPALGWIDGEIAKIRAELDRASQLRAEAEAALADCKARQAKAEIDARTIVTLAQQQVEAMQKQAETDLAASLKRQEQLAAERIRMAEAEAVAEVRAAAVALAMTLARKNLMENMPDAVSGNLIDKAIAEIPALDRGKAKAA
jgi:F-type H+-transporting ATPase subunit b